MTDEVRYLKWSDDILRFPCGIEVNITADKLKILFVKFKLGEEVKRMIETGEKQPIPKEKAFHIKSFLT